MDFDATLGSLETAADAARAAEAFGFRGGFTGEVSSDPFLPLALAAAATSHLELGTSIAVAFGRSPMALAYTAHDMQRLSRGRFVLGLGSQVKAHITRRFSMRWGRPAAQMREFVLALRAIWASWADGTPLAFEGDYYRHTLMPPTFVPPSHEFGAPPVYLAGVGTAMTEVAGEVADGFICHAFTTERWIRERTLPALAAGRERTGRTLDGYPVKAAIFLVTGSEAEMATRAETVRAQLAFYASTPSYRPILDLHGWGDVGRELGELSRHGRWREMAPLVDDDMLNAFAIVAPVEDVPDLLAKRCAGAVDRVSFLASEVTPDLLDRLRS